MVRTLIVALAAAALFSQAGFAAEPAPPSPPVEPVEILPIAFSPDGLSGPGGERLRTAMEQAQFIALGEDHGFAGSPQLAEALAHDATAISERQDAGPLYHAVEVGPDTVTWVAAQLEIGGLDALGMGLNGRPWAMPFLSNVEDAKLAAPFAAEGRLWGIDQEFVGSPSLLFDVLAGRTKDRATKALLAGWRHKDDSALVAGKFDTIFTAIATDKDFADLRTRFKGDSEALKMIDDLAESTHIYQLNNSGQYLQNNEERSALMQRYFLAAYRAAPVKAPRVLFKMGLNHIGRGTTPTSIVDLGSILPGLAAANGKTALTVAYVPLGGSVRQISPSPTAFTKVAPYEDEMIGPILDAAGIARERIPADAHVLIPLAALRHNLAGKALRELPAYAKFLLLGADYLVTTRGAEPATHFEALGKAAP
ncbi:hypothetical protein [Sphingopyxis sp.]|uniref:hypothetical protein n=1 Tax=Sphingopyxis sp. TaxID=1908224 RepID=UPI003BAABC0B